MPPRTIHLAAEHSGLTLAAALKRLLPDQSWSQVRKLLAARRVQVNGNLALDGERKVRSGDVVKILEHSLAPPASAESVRLVYVDEHLLVVQKPAGITTLRHREETDLPQRRKQLQPTLDELVSLRLAEHLGIQPDASAKRRRETDKRLKIRPVHRLDRDTSGLMVFARTPTAEQKLVRMFARHEVQRAYVAVVRGRVEAQTIDTWIVRDRGDGLRGSTPLGESAEGARRAVTHVRPMEQFGHYTVVECRLETGRTHQIRIHLSEIGHPLCGEKLYTHLPGQPPQTDTSGAPRHALHSANLAFLHPFTGRPLRFRMALPQDLKAWLLQLRKKSAPDFFE
jgi:23S rRNA pseudouridine1911/1915/1917 synthase